MIPQEKTAAVSRALREAFGVADCDDIQVLIAPGSDLLFRIVVKGSPYQLRIITRVNEQTDPARHFTCLFAAAEAGLTPRVRYTSIEDGVSITDFVKAVPLAIEEALVLVPRLLRPLHQLPAFPKTFNYVTAHNGFIWKFRTANIVPKDEVEAVFSRYEQLCAVYPRVDADMVSCHDNLKPENIVFDGERIWLVDWQAAFVNDRYFDLAIIANFVIRNEADEEIFLQEYFGRPSDEYERARFFLMRQVMHMLSATVFMMLSSAGKPVDRSAKLPSFRDFHQRIWADGLNLADSELRISYGRVHWEQLLHNVGQTRFHESLSAISARHRSMKVGRLLPKASANLEGDGSGS